MQGWPTGGPRAISGLQDTPIRPAETSKKGLFPSKNTQKCPNLANFMLKNAKKKSAPQGLGFGGAARGVQ